MKSPLEVLQPLGRALMLPIAVLPVAALLLRIGQPDLLGAPGLAAMTGGMSLHIANVFGAAGGAIFSSLGLIFAIGVAVGLARENHGAAGLAGVVCYVIATKGVDALMVVPPEVTATVVESARDLTIAAWKAKEIGKLSIPVGILSGVISGWLYNRYSNIKLPEYLAFFGGRRFVPIVAGLAGLVLAMVVGFGFQTISGGIDALSFAATSAGAPGVFAFGVLNRLLLVTGLHHVLNNVAWFVVGDWHGTTGDLRRFFAGDPSAGSFMAGFFPVRMFGLPAACLAMYHAAAPDRRKAVGGMLFSLALTSALTGVTEPIEFSFMFLAPLLYVIHALLTGLSMAVMDLLGVKLGFGFSAGLLDYVLNYGKATRPLLLLPVGAVYFLLYYGLFRFFIRRFDLPTPGREPLLGTPTSAPPVAAGGRGRAFAQALGGSANLTTVSACTTRLRLVVRDQAAVDEAALKALGARGVIRPSATALQVVLGPIADLVAVEIRDALAMGDVAAATPVADETAPLVLSDRLIAALGGAGNIAGSSRHHGRLRIALRNDAAADAATLAALGPHGIARPAPGLVHLLGNETALAALVVG